MIEWLLVMSENQTLRHVVHVEEEDEDLIEYFEDGPYLSLRDGETYQFVDLKFVKAAIRRPAQENPTVQAAPAPAPQVNAERPVQHSY